MGSSPNANKLDDIVIYQITLSHAQVPTNLKNLKFRSDGAAEGNFPTARMPTPLARAPSPDVRLGTAAFFHWCSPYAALCLRSYYKTLPSRGFSAGSGVPLLLQKAVPLPGRFAAWLKNYFVLARTKSVDNEPLRLESQHSFYHARTAAYSLRAYKQRVEYPSIPVRGSPPRSFLAPYDHSTSSGSSTGDPESANSD